MKNFSKIKILHDKGKLGCEFFDMERTIEVCRQHSETLQLAEELARMSKNLNVLVEIQIENRNDSKEALNIINK